MGSSIETMIEQAYGQLKEGYFEDAVEAFSDCLLLEPADARVYYGRGMARFQLKQWPLAVSDFQRANQLDADNAESWVSLGMSLAMDDKIYEAIDVFEALLTKKPQYIRAHIQLAQLYYKLGVITKGHRQLDIALTARPSLVERKEIESLKKTQLTLDKKRYYKPDFEALHRQNQTASNGLWIRIKSLFSAKSKE